MITETPTRQIPAPTRFPVGVLRNNLDVAVRSGRSLASWLSRHGLAPRLGCSATADLRSSVRSTPYHCAGQPAGQHSSNGRVRLRTQVHITLVRVHVLELRRMLTDNRKPESGAGGNRTPVHQPVDELATTIPGIATDAVTPTGRLSARGGPRSVFPESQQSFPLAVVFPTVIPHFCCRAVMEWPRATFLLTMTLRSPENQAARANCSSAILVVPPFYESEELGSQTRTALLTSKPVSPMFNMCSTRSPVR